MFDSTQNTNTAVQDDMAFVTDIDFGDGLDLDAPFGEGLEEVSEAEHTEAEAAPVEVDANTTPATETLSLEELRDAASVALSSLNAAYKTDSMSRIAKAKLSVDNAVNAFNKAYLDELFSAYLEDENPVLSAVRDGFCSMLKLVDKTTKEGEKGAGLDHATRVIDLQKLDKKAGERIIMKLPRWEAYSERLAYVFAIRATRDIGGDVDKLIAKYKMTEYGRSLRFGDEKARASEPDSMKSLIDAVQTALDAILFLGDGKHNALKVTSHDVWYMMYTVFRKGKDALTVAMPRHTTMIQALTEVAYKLVNGLGYDAEYQMIDKKGA